MSLFAVNSARCAVRQCVKKIPLEEAMKVKANGMNKALSLLVLVALLLGTIVPTVSAQSTTVAASSVKGTLIEIGSKHYLGLKVLDQTKPVKVIMDYRQDESRLDGGAGFYLFDEQSFQRFIGGDNTANLAAGAVQTNSSGLKQKIAIISNPVGTFSTVVFNDSGIGLDYTLTAENALIVDDSGEQVRNANAPASQEAVAESMAEDAAPAATVAATAAATASETTPVATATPAPRAPAIPVITRSESLQGDLDEQFSKHYFDLSVNDISKSVEILVSYDPQDQQALDNGFNVYAYSSDQFQALIRGGLTPNRADNTAAGTLTRKDGLKVLQATINSPFKTYTLIVGNDSTVPVSYTLTIVNGIMVDASGQSNTAKARMAASGETSDTTTTTTTTATATTATTTTTTTTTTAAPTVAAGSTYVVKAGDTIATIARAAYGDINLWDELCAFNQLANCDRIEVGDQITVPAQAELGTGSVAAPVAAAPAPSAAAAAAPVAATTTTTETTSTETTTVPVTTTTPAATPAASGTVIDVATGARQFEILLLALSLANLTDGLKGAGPLTLFAPADAAFASLPEKTLDSLLADTAQLARVLQYHVVPQKLTAATITNGMTVTTLMGQTLTFAVSGGKITVNGANVNATELPASNGSVFIIDSVLLPAQ